MTTTERRKQVPRDSILDLGDYERRRDDIRKSAMAARALRRVHLGPNATLSFENLETVRYQIQEMLRAERIAKEPEVQHEIETYSDLLPAGDALSATLMFEFSEPDVRPVKLQDLVGFENHLRVEIDGAGSAAAFFDRRQLDTDQISAVQFVRFPLTETQQRAVAAGAALRLVADHPRYMHAAPLSEAARAAIAADLAEAAS